ncbi:MAG: outer membrane protein [Beijerinckiaceae bacterium]
MSSLRTLALAGAVLAGATAVASAADLGPPPIGLPPVPIAAPILESSGWYLRGDIGVGQLDGKFEVLQTGVPTARGSHDSINSTFFGGVGVGYQFNSYLRADVTGEFRGSSAFNYKDSFCFDNVRGACGSGRPPSGNGVQGINSIRGNISSTVFLFNGYVDLGTWHGLTPFVGAGVGVTRNRIDGIVDNGLVDNFTNGALSGSSSPLQLSRDATKTNLAWALHAGVGYDVTQNLKLELGYRYLNLGKITDGGSKCSLASCAQVPTYYTRVKDIDSHDFRIGMRWMLGGPSYAAAPYEPPRVVKKF